MGDTRDIGDKEYVALKESSFLGIAKVELQALTFEHEFAAGHRALSRKVIANLQNTFRIGGCRRLPQENHISAVIGRTDYNRAVTCAGLGSGHEAEGFSVSNPPLLDVSNVKCLHGLHRVRAAEELLEENDRWWTIRLYAIEDVTPAVARRIVEDYCHSVPFADGEIFWKVRTYTRDGDAAAARRWRARLSKTKEKNFKQLVETRDQDELPLSVAFDRLLEFPGLWPPVQLGALHRLFALHCREEMIRYLEHIHLAWKSILGGVSGAVVDVETARRLQLLAPAISSADRGLVESGFRDGVLFAGVTSPQTRTSLLRNVLQARGMIPSLHTFFENLKYLEPCCRILNTLLPTRKKNTKLFKRSLREGFVNAYKQPPELRVEFAEGRTGSIARLSADSNFHVSYQQLWLFALRNFTQLTEATPRKEVGQAKPVAGQASPAIWHRMGSLAVELGFRTSKALALMQQDPDRELARQFLAHAELDDPGTLFLPQFTTLLQTARSTCQGRPQVGHDIVFASDVTAVATEQRCGRPFEASHLSDRRHVFLSLLCSQPSRLAANITSLYVKHDIFRNFLGSIPDQINQSVSMLKSSLPSSDSMLINAPMSGQNSQLAAPPITENSNAATQPQQLEVLNLHRENRSLQTDVQQLQARVDDLERSTSTPSIDQNPEMLSLRNMNQRLLHENRTFQDEIQRLQVKVNTLEAADSISGTDHARTMLDLKHSHDDLLIENTSLKEEVQQLQAHVDESETANRKLIADHTDLRHSHDVLLIEINKHKDEVRQLQDSLASQRSQHDIQHYMDESLRRRVEAQDDLSARLTKAQQKALKSAARYNNLLDTVRKYFALSENSMKLNIDIEANPGQLQMVLAQSQSFLADRLAFVNSFKNPDGSATVTMQGITDESVDHYVRGIIQSNRDDQIWMSVRGGNDGSIVAMQVYPERNAENMAKEWRSSRHCYVFAHDLVSEAWKFKEGLRVTNTSPKSRLAASTKLLKTNASGSSLYSSVIRKTASRPRGRGISQLAQDQRGRERLLQAARDARSLRPVTGTGSTQRMITAGDIDGGATSTSTEDIEMGNTSGAPSHTIQDSSMSGTPYTMVAPQNTIKETVFNAIYARADPGMPRPPIDTIMEEPDSEEEL